MHHHSRNDLCLTYPKTKYILRASTYQAGILLQFNESDSLTYDDIATSTGLSRELLQPHLELLIKQRLLLKPDKETFELNRQFASSKVGLTCICSRVDRRSLTGALQRRVNINVPIKAEVVTQDLEILTRTAEERRIEIQLVIVRIMKARKVSPAQRHTMLKGSVLT